MRIAIIQPTPFRKGHFYIYTKSLVLELIKKGYVTKIFANFFIIGSDFKERNSLYDFNLKSFIGILIYFVLSLISSINFFINRKKFNRLIILDCEYSCASILLIILSIFNWSGKVTLQINAPNFPGQNAEINPSFRRNLKLLQKKLLILALKNLRVNISCLGLWHKRCLAEQLRIKKERIFIIEDGGGGTINFENNISLDYIFNKNKIIFPKTNQPIFLLFGNFRIDKGHLFISQFWKKYFYKKNNPILWIVGNDEENLAKTIFSYKCPNIVICRNYIDSEIIKYIYKKSDFAILPYLANYCGGAGPLMKGAFTHSVFPIVSNVAEMGRLIKEEKLGYYFEPENEESLEKIIMLALNQKIDEIKPKIIRANKYANQRNWEELTKRFINSLS